MKQNWYFIFGEGSVFKKRYIKFYGTVEACRRNQIFWKLENHVIAILPEKDFLERSEYKDFQELNIETMEV